MSFYPLGDLEARAYAGNLFLCHVLKEGRPLHDPHRHFTRLKKLFRLRVSYESQIRHAADLGWLIVRFGASFPDSAILRRRITWVARTVLIARAAEAGEPVFAAQALLMIGPSTVTHQLITQKDAEITSPTALDDLRQFLTICNLADPCPVATSPAEFAELFVSSKNAVGQHFIKSIEKSANSLPYP